jgi:hypothetical protein
MNLLTLRHGILTKRVFFLERFAHGDILCLCACAVVVVVEILLQIPSVVF